MSHHYTDTARVCENGPQNPRYIDVSLYYVVLHKLLSVPTDALFAS